MDNLKFHIFRFIFLLIKIIFAAILSGLRVMRVMEKNGKTVSLGHIAFCIVVFQLSVC